MRLQRPPWFLGGLALLLSAAGAQGQGTFQNLGFESASLVPVSDISVQFAPAFPHWTCTVAGVQQTVAIYNTVALSESGICIIDQGWPYAPYGGVIDGNYTAILMGGVLGPLNPADTTLSQTGLVPGVAQSLRLKAYNIGSASPLIPLVVTLGGQQLSLVPLGGGANYTLLGADIHTLAGHTAELDFTMRGSLDSNTVFLDSIQFSNLPVPEPSVFGLFGLGALLAGGHVLRRRR